MKEIYSLAASMLFIILTATPFSGKAQVDTSTVQKLLQYIMQPLDKNQAYHFAGKEVQTQFIKQTCKKILY